MIDQFIQLGVSLVAILFLVLLAKIYWPQKFTLNEDRIRRAFERSDYEFEPRTIWLDRSANAAISLTNLKETLGYAFAFGDRVTCRPLIANDIKSTQSGGKNLTIHFSDFTLEARCFEFANEITCNQVKDAVDAILVSRQVQ